MVSRLHSRLERIEAAPIVNLIRERRAKLEDFRAHAKLNVAVDEALAGYHYIGRKSSRKQVESDLLELALLAIAEHHNRYGRWFANHSEIDAALYRSTMLLFREWYGRELSEDEARSEIETWSKM